VTQKEERKVEKTEETVSEEQAKAESDEKQ
jgi:hypothetical protein